MSTPTKSVAIITTSTRTPRVGPHVGAFAKSILDDDAKASNIELVPVDLADFKLPVYDEVIVPGMINPEKEDSPRFANAPSIAWSAEVKRHDGYVLVIPEYNYGLAGATKNAIDFLMHEWRGKPVAVISYGIEGGSVASEHAAQTLNGMKLRVAETRPQLTFAGEHGPDLYAAMLKGDLGEDSKEGWRKEKSEDILKAFAEVKKLLNEEVKKE